MPIIVVLAILAGALWLLFKALMYVLVNKVTIMLWIGPVLLLPATWFTLKAVHRLTARHPAEDAVRSRSVVDADRYLCRSDTGGLPFMHAHQALNADALTREVQEETSRYKQTIAQLQAELKRLGAVHAGSDGEALAAVNANWHDTELRKALIRRLAEQEGMHVQDQ